MTCAEFKESVDAFALGALDAEETAACEQHLAADVSHEGCNEALAAAREVVSLLAASLPPQPAPPTLWGRIEGAIAVPPPARRRPWRAATFVASFAAAAALLLLWWSDGRRRQAEDTLARVRHDLDAAHGEANQLREGAAQAKRACEQEIAATRKDLDRHLVADALLSLPSTRVVSLAAQGTFAAHATAVINLERGNAMVVAASLPGQPGKDYELWVLRGKAAVPAGLLHADENGAVLATVDPALVRGGVDAFAVSIEPTGGSAQPTGPVVLVGKIPRT